MLCGKIGALAATYCLEEKGPQSQRYSLEDFITRFRTQFDDAGALDALIKD
jgi:adenosine kinase